MLLTRDPSVRLNIKKAAVETLLKGLPRSDSTTYSVTVVTADGRVTEGVGMHVYVRGGGGRTCEVSLSKVRSNATPLDQT